MDLKLVKGGETSFHMRDMYESERSRPIEHAEGAAGTVRQLPPEVSSAAGGMGEGPTYPGECCILNDAWIFNLRTTSDGNTASSSRREGAARILGGMARRETW